MIQPIAAKENVGTHRRCVRLNGDETVKSGICPKCGSDEVYSGADIVEKQGVFRANTITTGGRFFHMTVSLDNYVCVDCGYVESYISDSKALLKIAEKWPRADGRPKRKRKKD